jgi:integrase
MKKADYGDGRVFQRGKRGTWYVRYSINGLAYTERAVTESGRPVQTETEARIFLKRKLNEAGCGLFVAPQTRNLRVSELWEPVENDYRENGKYLPGAESRWRLHLEPFFGGRKLEQVGHYLIVEYRKKRAREGAKPATINREVVLLHRMFVLAKRAGKVRELPAFPERLSENNARKGFVEHADFKSILAGTTELWLRALLVTLYHAGDRLGELIPTQRHPERGLRVNQVDFANGVIRLDSGETKNGEGRVLPITLDMKALLTACLFGKKPSDYVFTLPVKAGSPIGPPVHQYDLRTAWNQLTRKLGLGSLIEYLVREGEAVRTVKKWKPSLLIHDFRRSATRNLVNAGVPIPVAMKITGHKTDSVFRRYAIVSEANIVEAGRKIAVKPVLDAIQLAQTGTNLAQVDFSTERENGKMLN